MNESHVVPIKYLFNAYILPFSGNNCNGDLCGHYFEKRIYLLDKQLNIYMNPKI